MSPDPVLHHVGDLFAETGGRHVPGLQNDERFDDLAPQRVRLTDDGGLRDRRMTEDGALHLERADAVSRTLDHVVRSALEPEVTVSVTPRQVANGHPAAAEKTARAWLIAPVAERVAALKIHTHSD